MARDDEHTESTDEKSERKEMEESSLRWLGVGIEFCVVVVLCTLFGNWLDGKWGTSPGFLILFFLFGFGGMLYSMIKRAGGIKWK